MATIRSIGTRARSAIAPGTLTSWTSSRSRVAQLGQRDHLHEPAVGGLVGGDELGLRRGLAERVEHPGLGGHDGRRCRGAPRRSEASRRSRACGRPARRRLPPRRTPSRWSSIRIRGGSGSRPRDGPRAQPRHRSVGFRRGRGIRRPTRASGSRASSPRRPRGTCRGRTGSRSPRRARAGCARPPAPRWPRCSSSRSPP